MKNLAIFASGSGSNAVAIINHFKNDANITVSCIVTNNKNAGIIEKAKALNIPTVLINRADFFETNNVVNLLKEKAIDSIVLAGFLWLIPATLIQAFPNKIVNIHPSLLPKFGGKGMYGINIHKAVIEAKEQESGLTIHYVNEKFDDGEILFQTKCNVLPTDTPEDLAARILKLEHINYPKVIEQLWA